MGEWISVKDRLPEDGEVVLVFTKATRTHKIFYMDNGEWKDDLYDTLAPIHWMPLPKPPKRK